jgi:hypothetical protein
MGYIELQADSDGSASRSSRSLNSGLLGSIFIIL